MKKFILGILAVLSFASAVCAQGPNMRLLRTDFQDQYAEAGYSLFADYEQWSSNWDIDLDELDAIVWWVDTVSGEGTSAWATPCKCRSICNTPWNTWTLVPWVQGEAWAELHATGTEEAYADAWGNEYSDAFAQFQIQANPNFPGHANTGTLKALLNYNGIVVEDFDTSFYAEWWMGCGSSYLSGTYLGGGLYQIEGEVMQNNQLQYVFTIAGGIVIACDEQVSVGNFVSFSAGAWAESNAYSPAGGGTAIHEHIMLPHVSAEVEADY